MMKEKFIKATLPVAAVAAFAGKNAINSPDAAAQGYQLTPEAQQAEDYQNGKFDKPVAQLEAEVNENMRVNNAQETPYLGQIKIVMTKKPGHGIDYKKLKKGRFEVTLDSENPDANKRPFSIVKVDFNKYPANQNPSWSPTTRDLDFGFVRTVHRKNEQGERITVRDAEIFRAGPKDKYGHRKDVDGHGTLSVKLIPKPAEPGPKSPAPAIIE